MIPLLEFPEIVEQYSMLFFSGRVPRRSLDRVQALCERIARFRKQDRGWHPPLICHREPQSEFFEPLADRKPLFARSVESGPAGYAGQPGGHPNETEGGLQH